MLNNILEFSKRSNGLNAGRAKLFVREIVPIRGNLDRYMSANLDRSVHKRRTTSGCSSSPTSRVALSIDVYLAAGRSLSVDE